MILHASKKQRCYRIESETGAVQFIDEESTEEAERRALCKLDLWKHADYERLPQFLSTSNSSNGPVDTSRTLSDSTSIPSVEAVRLKAIENTHKSLMECSLLLSMTGLINNQEFLTLQTCSRSAIQPRGIVLPPGQVVEIRRNEFKSSENVVATGITAALRIMNERRLFAEGILEIRKNWRILSHSSIIANRKNSQSRIVQLDGRERDTLYVDCSFVSSGDKASSLDQFLVPLQIGRNGPVLGSKEENIICTTLKITMKHRSTGLEIASTTAWQIKQIEDSSVKSDSASISEPISSQQKSESITQSESKSNDEESDFKEIPDLTKYVTPCTESSLLSSIDSHCQRRQHDAMSRRLFAKLRKAAVDDNDRHIIQSNNGTEHSTLCESNTISDEINNLSVLFDSELVGSLEVTIVRKGCIELNLSGNISLLITLEPIPKPDKNNNVIIEKNDSTPAIEKPPVSPVSSVDVIHSGEEYMKIDMNDYLQIDMKESIKVDIINKSKNDMKMDIDENENENENDIENKDGDDLKGEEAGTGAEPCDVTWIQDLFSCSIMKAQLILLEHWSSSKQAEAEKERKENIAIAAATLASDLKMKPLVNSKICVIPATQAILLNSTQHLDFKIGSTVHPTDIYSDSLSGINVLKRLINPVLRSKVRDVGDGTATTLAVNRSTDESLKTKESSTTASLSHYDTVGSVNGRILLGLLDVIRCGLQKYRVIRILKSLERNVCTDLKVFLQYDYFPSKLTKKSLSSVHDVDAGDKNHPAGILIEGKCDDNDIKLNCNDKTVQGDRLENKEIKEEEDKKEKMDDEEKEGIQMKEGEVISSNDNVVSNSDIKEKMTVKTEKEMKEKEEKKKNSIIKEEKIQLLKSRKIKEDNIRIMKKDFMTEFLSSETAEFFVTLPDCCLLISATSRYGFQLKSVIYSEASEQFPSFIDYYSKNDEFLNGLHPAKENHAENSVEISKHSARHCDTLYHPMSVRLSRTQELVSSLDSLVMGSCLSWALRDVRDTSSLSVTQISATFFSLHLHSIPSRSVELNKSIVTSDTAHYSLMRLDDVNTPRKESASMINSHSHSHSNKEDVTEGFDESPVNTHMATIRIQQKTLSKDNSNHQHSTGDRRYQVDIEFGSLDGYDLVRSQLSKGFPSLNASLILSVERDNCGNINTANMKIQFFIGPEIDNLRDFVTSLCAAYPIPINHCIQ